MYSTRTRAHPQRTSSRGKARVGQKSADKSGELNGPQLACCAREVGEEVRVGVSVDVRVRVGPVEFKLNQLTI